MNDVSPTIWPPHPWDLCLNYLLVGTPSSAGGSISSFGKDSILGKVNEHNLNKLYIKYTIHDLYISLKGPGLKI